MKDTTLDTRQVQSNASHEISFILVCMWWGGCKKKWGSLRMRIVTRCWRKKEEQELGRGGSEGMVLQKEHIFSWLKQMKVS